MIRTWARVEWMGWLMAAMSLHGSMAAQDRVASEPRGRAFGATARAEAPVPSTNELDATAAGTTLRLDERSRAGETLRDALVEIPGVRPLASGGPGQLTFATLRGADVAHTTVMIGDLPVSGPDGGGLDLGILPLAAFGALEVYRGGAPAWLGEGAIGGVIRLVPHAAPDTHAGSTFTLGAFGTWEARAHSAVRLRDGSFFGAVGTDGSAGDFRFLDDGGTRFDNADDREVKRQNAETLGGHVLLHAQLRLGPGNLDTFGLWIAREGGVPGPASSPALAASRSLTRYLGAVAYTIGDDAPGHVRLQLLAGAGYDRSRFWDRFAEIGTGRQGTDDRAHRILGRVAASWRPWRPVALTLVTSARRDVFDPDDAYGTTVQQPSSRETLAATSELVLRHRAGNIALELRPSVRIEWSGASLSGQLRSAAGATTTLRPEVIAPTYRVGALIAPFHWLTVSASIASGTRLPSLLELFGNRSTLLSSLDLRPERSLSIDGGVVVRKRIGQVRIRAELRGFSLVVDDLVRYRRTAQFTAVAQNIDRGTMRGIEFGLSGQATRFFKLSGALTRLSTADELNRELPMRPPLQVFARVDARTAELAADCLEFSVFGSVEHVAANAVDPANLVVVGERTWVDIGAGVSLPAGFSLSLSVRDLFDVRGQDLLGFPLPGRRALLTLSFETEDS